MPCEKDPKAVRAFCSEKNTQVQIQENSFRYIQFLLV
jgi:hypothetical protein